MVKSLIYFSLVLPYLPLLWFFLRKRRYSDYSIFFVLYLSIFVFLVVGSMYVILDDEVLSVRYYLCLLLLIFSLYFFISVIAKRKLVPRIQWERVRISRSNVILVTISLWVISLSLVGLYLRNHGMPLLFNIRQIYGGGLIAMRQQMTYIEGFHWYRLGFYEIPPFIALYLFIVSRHNKHLVYTVLFWISLFMAFALSISFMHKSVLVITLVKIGFAYLIIHRDIKRPVLIFLLSVLLLYGLYYAYVPSRAPEFYAYNLTKTISRRVFGSYTISLARVFDTFPSKYSYLYGRTFPNPGGVLPYTPVNLPQLMYALFIPHKEIVGNMSISAMGTSYANFGFLGIVFTILAVFVISYLFHFVFHKLGRNALYMALYISIAFNMIDFSRRNIVSLISPMRLIFYSLPVILYALSKALSSILKARSKSRTREPKLAATALPLLK
jgi:hypothetical protein